MYAQAMAIRVRTGTLETPEGADLLLSLGRMLMWQGDLEDARAKFEQALGIHHNMGTLETRLGSEHSSAFG